MNCLRAGWNRWTVTFITGPLINFIRDPLSPFVDYASTLILSNVNRFINDGFGVTWTPFDVPGTGYQASVAEIDPTTGLPRLIFGNSQGIWSVLDNNGVAETTLGNLDSSPERESQRRPSARAILLWSRSAQ